MKNFNAIDYLAIDIANQYGLDKLNFEQRIQWVRTHVRTLEQQHHTAEEPQLYLKAVHAFRQALDGQAIGHTVALDAVCSGLQIMSVLTGCRSGCELTGLIDPHTRTDAYSLICQAMQVDIPRKDAKEAVMQTFYGSKSIATKLFGQDTATYHAFYQTLQNQAPGAWMLLQQLLQLWNPTSHVHQWSLPDGYIAYIPVMQKKHSQVYIEELKHNLEIVYEENSPSASGISLPANLIHSIDAYVLRSLIRRCNYPLKQAQVILELLNSTPNPTTLNGAIDAQLQPHIQRYQRSAMLDLRIIQDLNADNIQQLPSTLNKQLKHVLTQVLKHPPFEIIPVHDSFACHPNHCNQLRFWYKEILAELAASNVLEYLLNQLSPQAIKVQKLDEHLAAEIAQSNYAIC